MIIEGTSRCTLACPACPRTWFSDKFSRPFPKHDLDIDVFSRFIDCKSGQEIDKFTFNGNHGDVIYWPQLFDFLKTFKNKRFIISTNGSHQRPEFWKKLSTHLKVGDTVFFSIDGLEDTNGLYRRNADWNSIMQAIDIMRHSDATLVWKSLVFSSNQHQQQQMEDLASSFGMKFVSDITNRFGDESLRPNENLVLTDRRPDVTVTKIEPRCSSLEYVSADGYYWPCCMISSMFTLQKTPLWKQRDQWLIHNQNLDQAREKLENFKKMMLVNPHIVCQMHCKEGQKDLLWTRLS